MKATSERAINSLHGGQERDRSAHGTAPLRSKPSPKCSLALHGHPARDVGLQRHSRYGGGRHSSARRPRRGNEERGALPLVSRRGALKTGVLLTAVAIPGDKGRRVKSNVAHKAGSWRAVLGAGSWSAAGGLLGGVPA